MASSSSTVVATKEGVTGGDQAAAAAEEKKKMITLRSLDGEEFSVESAVAMQSTTLKNLVDDLGEESAIPLPNVSASVLAKVLEYCRKHADKDKDNDAYVDKAVDEELKSFDADFVKVDQGTLFDIILAANYLNITGLLDLTCKTVADMMRGKSPEEIRKTFHIINDYTAAEEAEVRRENAWAFE